METSIRSDMTTTLLLPPLYTSLPPQILHCNSTTYQHLTRTAAGISRARNTNLSCIFLVFILFLLRVFASFSRSPAHLAFSLTSSSIQRLNFLDHYYYCYLLLFSAWDEKMILLFPRRTKKKKTKSLWRIFFPFWFDALFIIHFLTMA